MRRAHDPPRLGRRGPRLRRHPQHKTGRARGLRCQRQLATGDEVELLRLTPDLEHDGAHRIAGQRVGRRPQRLIDIGRANGDETTRIEAEFGKPVHRDGAGFDFGEILPDPHQRPPCGHTPCKPRDKAGRRRALPSGFGKHLMHDAQSQPALQVCIRLRMPERHLAQATCRAMRLDALDVAA